MPKPRNEDQESTGPVVQQAERPKESAGAKVTVACKLPHGLALRVFRFVEQPVPVMGGGTRIEKTAFQDGAPVLLKGNAVAFGAIPRHQIVGGFALTEGVDKDFWDRWLEANRNSDVVRNGLVFAYEKTGMAADAAAEREDLRSGLEPLAKDRDPRVPRSPYGLKVSEGNRTAA